MPDWVGREEDGPDIGPTEGIGSGKGREKERERIKKDWAGLKAVKGKRKTL